MAVVEGFIVDHGEEGAGDEDGGGEGFGCDGVADGKVGEGAADVGYGGDAEAEVSSEVIFCVVVCKCSLLLVGHDVCEVEGIGAGVEAAGLEEVDVGIGHAGDEVFGGAVDYCGAWGKFHFFGCVDFLNEAVFYEDGGCGCDLSGSYVDDVGVGDDGVAALGEGGNR